MRTIRFFASGYTHLTLMLLFLAAAAAIDPPVDTIVWKNGDEGSKYYRIPGITTTTEGTLITVIDRMYTIRQDLPNDIDLVIRRSTDNGRTWEESVQITHCVRGKDRGYSDASLVVDRKTNTILCLFNGNNGYMQSEPDDLIRMFFCKSTDDGRTWSEPRDITNLIYGKDCPDPERRNWKGMFITAGQALQMRNGRIFQSCVTMRSATTPTCTYAVYTDDLGETWHVSSMVCERGDEGKTVELNNGSLLMSIRHTGFRYFTMSHDGGVTWDPYWKQEDIWDPGCNGEMILYTSVWDGYDKNRIVHTMPYSRVRENMTLLLSYDEGKTWPVKKTVWLGGTAYSCCTITKDGKIALFYERQNGQNDGFDIVCTVVTLDWLTDGADTWTPPVIPDHNL